jgi:phosphoenolpyruvate carboxylase
MAKKIGRPRKASKTKRAVSAKRRAAVGKRWSGNVTKHSNALDLEKGVFTSKNPARIAASLKRSAEASKRRKADPYRSALSMLIFYRNRAGRNLPQAQKHVLDRAKAELRKAFGRQ